MYFDDFDQGGLNMLNSSEDPEHRSGPEYMQTQCVLADGGDRFGVNALCFDDTEELLWMGNQGGHVTSYFTGLMQKYTSFQVHSSQEVRQIVCMNDSVLLLTATSLRCQLRRGIPIFTHTSVNMKDMQCMLRLLPNRLLIGGHTDVLVEFNLGTGKETKTVHAGNAGCVMLRNHCRYICAGNPLGQIDLRDPNTLQVEHTFTTHSGSLSDFDVQGNLLVTCGFSNRQGNHLSVDRFLMVYDLRMMRGAMTPMQTVLDPLYLRFMPSISSRLAVVSAMGQIQILDTVALTEPMMCVVNVDNPGAMCSAFDISTSSQAMAVAYDSGYIHLVASSSEPVFNSYSRLTDHSDSPVQSYCPSFMIDDYDTPLSVVPMSMPIGGIPSLLSGSYAIASNDMTLASDWPAHLMKFQYRKSPAIGEEILRTMKMKGPIGYAPNAKSIKRNQVQYDLESTGTHFANNSYNSNKTFPADLRRTHVTTAGDDCASVSFVAIPKRYRKLDIKFSKMGTEDAIFEQFNKTGLPGLEAILPNAYCNAMIQVLYYMEPLRSALLSHLCSKEFCLACEMGFLFHMMTTTPSGTSCQPGNFLRAFRTVPEASALGLILSDSDAKQRLDLGSLIQSWNRFILHQMHAELLESGRRQSKRPFSNEKVSSKAFIYKDTDFPSISVQKLKDSSQTNEDLQSTFKHCEDVDEELTEISRLFSTTQLLSSTCLKCSNRVLKNIFLLVCNLDYPNYEDRRDEWSFCELLRKSLTIKQTTPAWCEACEKFQPTSQVRTLQTLPDLLSINTGLNNVRHRTFWQTQMDRIVARAATSELPTTRSSTPTYGTVSNLNPTKLCRYGDSCSRPGCRFRHSFDNVTTQPATTPSPVASSSNPYCSNNWLPHRLRIRINKDDNSNSLDITKIADSEVIPDAEDVECNKTYHLSAVVCYIHETAERKNVVALIKLPIDTALNPSSPPCPDGRWYLFNDFSINPVPAHEATWFSLDWKTPCILYYATKSVAEAQTPVTLKLNKEVFTEDNSIARGAPAATTFTPLGEEEFPKPGELVAMDAEFVTLNQEESELRSDGKMSTVKPSQLSVARVTCIRGQGSNEGVPFIDDYISTQEQVVDYLTKFSGINPGDLDANFSSKHLTTLKSTYIKLRFLVDSGVIFVGHGLKNDFRVINLVVPPRQIVDTVLLFHLPHHRMVSLRFLAWHFLGIKIQSETHDSTEDARAALQLYRQYKELEEEGRVGDALSELYETGKIHNWRVP